MIWNPDPIAFNVFGVPVAWYGLSWSFAILIGYFVMQFIFKKEQRKYIPVIEPDLSVFTGQELQHIDYEIKRLGDKTARELSDFSHQDVPWISAKIGEDISYESVFYRTEKTSVRKYEEDRL